MCAKPSLKQNGCGRVRLHLLGRKSFKYIGSQFISQVYYSECHYSNYGCLHHRTATTFGFVSVIFPVWLLAFGFWLLSFGFCPLAFAFWLLATGHWLLASDFWLSRSHLDSISFMFFIVLSIPFVVPSCKNHKL